MDQRHDITPGRGFTLIEGVIILVFMATLSAFALPAYHSFTLRSHRSEVRSTLMDMAGLEDRVFDASSAFSDDPRKLGFSAIKTPFTIGSGYYKISSIVATPSSPPDKSHPQGIPATYLITAEAVGLQRKDSACLVFTITAQGQQGSGPELNADCWRD
jgi:type IV pilus assembly protein PilE